MQYLDFEIEIGPGSGREYPIQVLNSPAGEAQETLKFPYDTLELDNRLQALQIALLRSGGKRRKTLTDEEKAVLEFGRSLFDALFTGEVRSRYDVSQGEADRLGAGLRIKLRIQSPELASLPWEFLYDPREAEFICFSRNRPMVRYIDLPRSVKPLMTDPPLQILGMVVGPRDLPELNVEREKQRLEEALRGFQEQGWVNLTWLEGGTWRDLQRALQVGPYHVFHFIGHGGFDPHTDEGLLALLDRDGTADLKSSTQMGRLLADHHSLRLVVLNACEGARGSQQDLFSSTAANLVRKGIPAVLAMQYEITDQAAIVFARGFYDALVNGIPIDAAVSEARKAISLAVDNTIEWGTPVLYLRSADGVIFDFSRTKPVQAPAAPAPSAPASEERDLRELYNRANSAYWLEDWEVSARRFEEVLERDPSYEDAPAKLEHARRQARIVELKRGAEAAREAEDWPAAARAYEAILAENPEQKGTAEQLAEVRKLAELLDLYGEARSLTGAGEWPAAQNVLARMRELDPAYPDPEGLQARVKTGLAAQERASRLRQLHEGSLAAMDRGDWQAAQQALREIQSLEPADRDAARLLARVELELAKMIPPPEPPAAEGKIPSPAGEPGSARPAPRAASAGVAAPPPITQTTASPPAAISTGIAGEPVWMAWRRLLDEIPQAFDPAGWAVYGRWVAANALGWIATWVVATLLFEPVMTVVYNTDIGIESLATWVVLAVYLLAGSGLIFGQWWVLRGELPGLGLWRRVSLVGWVAGLLLPLLLQVDMYHYFVRVFALALLGTSLGFLQWITLRDRLPDASVWVPANILAWVLAAALGGGTFILGATSLQSFLTGALVGLVTGVPLVVLLHSGETRRADPDLASPPPSGTRPPPPQIDSQPGARAAGVRLPASPDAPRTSSPPIHLKGLNRALLGSWLAANALGWAAAWGLATFLHDPLYNLVWNAPLRISDVWVGRLLDLVVGAGFSAAQAFIIRRFLPGVKNWWLLSLAGWEIGTILTGPLVISIASNVMGDESYLFLIFMLTVGTTIGVTTWLTLRKRLAHPWWWIPANSAAWGLASLPGNGAFAMGVRTFQAFLPGAIVGFATGIALVYLVRKGHSTQQSLE